MNANRPHQILGVAEIVLNVCDLPAMQSFYEATLGFEFHSAGCHENGMEHNPDGEPTIVFLEVGKLDTPLSRHGHPILLALIDFKRHIFAKQRFVGHDPSRSPLNHLAFEIAPDTYSSSLKALRQQGLEPQEVAFPKLKAKAIFFRDPESNTLELICHQAADEIDKPS